MTLCRLSHLLCGGGDDTLVSWRGDRTFDLAQMRADVAAVASRFDAGAVAALFCEDSYRFAVGLFGLLHAGVRVILPPGGQADMLKGMPEPVGAFLDDAGVEAAMAPPHGARALAPLAPIAVHVPAIVFFTSGSTGVPKRIVKSLAMFEREVALFERCFGAGLERARVYATVPHQHMYGLPFKILWSLAAGRAFSAQTHGFWEPLLAEVTAGAILVSSPAHLSRLSALPPLAPGRRPGLVLSAGAPLSKDASEETLSILGVRPTEIFGSTETGAIATRSVRCGDDDPWRLLPGISILCGEGGALSVRTPVVGEDEIALSDVVVPVEGGFVHRGRADSTVKIEGKRIDLLVVERALCAHPLVMAAAVIALGVPLRPAAAVVITDEGKRMLATMGPFRFGRYLARFLRTQVDPMGVPRRWRFVDALGTHPMGKRRHADIVALFHEDA